jgi:hypothetical protein
MKHSFFKITRGNLEFVLQDWSYETCLLIYFIRIYQATNSRPYFWQLHVFQWAYMKDHLLYSQNLDKTKGDFEDLIKFSLLKLTHYQPPQKYLNRGK